jgi:hypothetical protein
MSDKKVERGFRSQDGEHHPTPRATKVTDNPTETATTGQGALPSLDRDKGKSDLLDKFREREERVRREEDQRSREDQAGEEVEAEGD